MTSDEKDSYCFDEYTLCLKTRELCCANKSVVIENKTFDFLAYLLTHHDRVVLKEELQKTLWDNRPISESVLSRCAMKARRAINDDGQAQNKIKTIPGRGFRYIGNVKHTTSKQAARISGANKQVRRISLAQIFSRRAIVITTIALLLVFFSTIGMINRKPNTTESPKYGTQQKKQSDAVVLLPLINNTAYASLEWPETLFFDSLYHYISSNSNYSWQELDLLALEYPSNSPQEIINWVRKNHGIHNKHLFIGKLTQNNHVYILDYQLHHPDNSYSRGRIIDLNATTLAKIAARQLPLQIAPGGKKSSRNQPAFQNSQLQKLFSNASKLHHEKKYPQALTIYKSILDQKESDMVKYKLADILQETGQLEQSTALLSAIISNPELLEKSDLHLPSLLMLADIKTYQGHYQEAKSLYETAMHLAADTDNKEMANRVLIHVGKLETLLDNYSMADKLLKTALNRNQKNNNKEGEADALSALASLALTQGKITNAKSMAEEAFTIYRATANAKKTINSMILLGKILYKNGMFAQSSTFLREAINSAHTQSHSTMELEAIVALAKAKQGQRNLNYSLDLLDKASKLNNTGMYSRTTQEINFIKQCALILQKKISDLSQITRQRDELLNKGWASVAAEFSYEIGSLQLRSNDLKNAEQQAMLASKISSQISNLNLQSKSIRLKANIYHAKGNFEHANNLYHKALMLANGIENKKVATDITIDLLYLLLQNKKMLEADMLHNKLSRLSQHYRVIAVDAYYLYKKGNFKAALKRYEEAAILTKESWNNNENTLYSIYQESANSNQEKSVDFIDLLLAEI